MGAEKITKLNSNYETEVLRNRNEVLESIIEFSVAETVKNMKSEIEHLKTERDTYKAQAELVDVRIAELKKAYDIAKANIERQLAAEKEQQVDNYKYNTTSKKIKPLENKVAELETELSTTKESLNKLQAEKDSIEKQLLESDTLLKSREEEINRLMSIESKIDTIYSVLTSNFKDIKEMLVNDKPKDEIIKAVEKMEEALTIEEECIQIHNLLGNGSYKKREIAALVYPGLSRGPAKVSERIRSDKYKELFGELEQEKDMQKR